MNFKDVIAKVYSLCIDLQEQGKFIEPEVDLKHKEIGVWFNPGFVDAVPFSTSGMSHWEYSENPTPEEIKDGDKQGNFYSLLQFLKSLAVAQIDFKGMDLNEIKYTIESEAV